MTDGSVPPLTMRTLQLGNDWPRERIGGLNRYVSELLRHLPGTGTSVRGFVIGPEDIREETNGVVTSFAQSKQPIYRRLYNARRAVSEELDRGNIDLLASHFALYASSLAFRAKDVPLVVHFHGPWAAESDVEGSAFRESKIKHLVERSVYRRAKRFIVLSKAFERELVSRYGVNEQLTRVVPGGIDLDRFNDSLSRTDARAHLGWPQDRPILLAVRRMVRRMGLENLIDAVRTVSATHPTVLLLLGGSGPIADELQKRVREYGMEENIRFLGRVKDDELPIAYRAADLTIVPSQSLEGFGMITLESLACGTPALVTPVGGLPEIVEPLAPQCIFAKRTTEEIAGTLVEVLAGTRPLPSSQACRAYASKFSWSQIAAQVRSVYDEALV